MTQTISKTDMLKEVRKVFIVTLALNLVVAISELTWGYYTHTLSLVADGFHSLLDATSNVVGILGINVAMQPADSDHPYGHRKFEAMASMIISAFIFFTCFEIASAAFHRIFNPGHETPAISLLSYGIKFLGLGMNIFVVRYESFKSKVLNSELLASDAKHTFSDMLVSISVLASMAAIQLGYAWLDVVMAFVISIIILRVGLDILRIHLGALVDEAVLDPAEVEEVVMAVPGVKGCHKIRSRGMSSHIFIDLHIQVDPSLTVKEAHKISYEVENTLETAFAGCVEDVLVHVEEAEETP